MEIRTAEQRDLPQLLALYRHLNPDDPVISISAAREIFDQFNRQPDSLIFVGLKGPVLATTCTLVVTPNLTRGGAPYALIENVVTHTDHRQCGHGRAILKAAADAAWRAGCYKVMLMTGSKDPATLQFYRDAGFEQTKTGFQIRRVTKAGA
jgi:GNAT superfamily N-acetyltransferase